MVFKVALALGAVLSASVANAHQIMAQPVPYNNENLNNSPLNADGSDFPCKLRENTYLITHENEMAVGEPQELSFIGSATHGGGSCQVSLTTDREPTKDSKWSVIKSIEGGCTADTSANLAGGESMKNPYVFNFTIPDSVAPGKYSLAWTWFNHVGNREMYMNCAPVTVTGGSSSKRSEDPELQKRSLDSLPDMFVANVNGCTTSEGEDIRFPNPGDDVEYAGQPDRLAPVGKAACTGTPTFGGAGMAAGGSDSEPASTTTAAAEPSVSLTVAVPVFTAQPTTTSEAPAVVPTTTATTTTAYEPSVPAETSAVPEPSGSGSSSGGLSGPCTEEGLWNCIDGSTFQRCASGTWTPSQAMAAGTECTVGKSTEFAVKAAALKPRMLKDMRSRRRFHSGHIHA